MPNGFTDDLWIATDTADLIDYERLDFMSRQRLTGAMVPTPLGRVQAGVVAIPFVFLGAVARRH
ncbi:MAG: hypothetical protein LW699_05235, partial [Pirellula sp.]|nr:hypothetical protein [Pirellula sp.]